MKKTKRFFSSLFALQLITNENPFVFMLETFVYLGVGRNIMSNITEIAKNFSLENSIPENVTKVLLKKTFESVLAKKYPPTTIIEFDIDNSEFLIIDSEKSETKTLKDLGRRFILSCKQEFSIILNQTYPIKFPLSPKSNIKQAKTNYREYYEDGPYCSACMQAPCMCSDREESSNVYDF